MKVTVIKKEDVTTSYWAGGESRQYYIFPTTSSYAARDFRFRLSQAVSNSDKEAKYSNLDNITRHLIMLEGRAHVFHKGHYNIVMNPYKEIDVFDGGWESSAKGKVTDFNMMLSKDTHGKMTVIDRNGLTKIGINCDVCNQQYNKTAFFCGEGNTKFIFSTGESISLDKGNLILLEDYSATMDINIQLLNGSKLVRMDICCY